MKKSLTMMFLIGVVLVSLDLAVAGVLAVAADRGKLVSLVRYFEYGRSVPGKLAQWEANPSASGNLYDVAWRTEIVSAPAPSDAINDALGPVVRSYGMSFVDNILNQARFFDTDISIDLHSGPAAPPNFTYALFFDDARNRQEGDFVVLGILSSSVPALASMSNRTWIFEQPAPFTYPIFYPDEGGLRRIEPLINTSADERNLYMQPGAKAEWRRQLSQQDMFYSPVTFGATWADQSPFARLVRRSLAKGHNQRVEDDILSGAYPYAQVLQTMISTFAAAARNVGQIPIVVLVQSNGINDVNLLEILEPILAHDNIPYFATAEHFDPRNPAGFLGDGHYRPEIDQMFGEKFANLIESLH